MEDLGSLSPNVVSSHLLLEPFKIWWSVMYHLYIVSSYSWVYPSNKKKNDVYHAKSYQYHLQHYGCTYVLTWAVRTSPLPLPGKEEANQVIHNKDVSMFLVCPIKPMHHQSTCYQRGYENQTTNWPPSWLWPYSTLLLPLCLSIFYCSQEVDCRMESHYRFPPR